MLTDERLWDLWNSQGTDEMSKAEAFVFARAVESEVRAQYTALIRQQVEAAITIYPHLNALAVSSGEALTLLQQQIAAITAGRAHLKEITP